MRPGVAKSPHWAGQNYCIHKLRVGRHLLSAPLTRSSGDFVDISLFGRLEEVLFRLRFCLLLLIGLVRVLTLG